MQLATGPKVQIIVLATEFLSLGEVVRDLPIGHTSYKPVIDASVTGALHQLS